MLSLPSDCQLAIVLAARDGGGGDWITLASLLLVCREINGVIGKHFAQIVEHYTIPIIGKDRVAYTFCGLKHRDNDEPAVIYNDGEKAWYRFGKIHRDTGILDLPARVYPNGAREWHLNGMVHRDEVYDEAGKIIRGGPAIIYPHGRQDWYRYGYRHRGGGLPAVVEPGSRYEWFWCGFRHRDGGKPAARYWDGSKNWYTYGRLIKSNNMNSLW